MQTRQQFGAPLVPALVVALTCGGFEYVILFLLLDDARTLSYVFVVSAAAFTVADAAAGVRWYGGATHEVAALGLRIQLLLIEFVLFCAVVVIASVRYEEPERFLPGIEFGVAFIAVMVLVSMNTRIRDLQ